jgi:hypothetical protein
VAASELRLELLNKFSWIGGGPPSVIIGDRGLGVPPVRFDCNFKGGIEIINSFKIGRRGFGRKLMDLGEISLYMLFPIKSKMHLIAPPADYGANSEPISSGP